LIMGTLSMNEAGRRTGRGKVWKPAGFPLPPGAALGKDAMEGGSPRPCQVEQRRKKRSIDFAAGRGLTANNLLSPINARITIW
jgi:hypothetical protein